MLKTIVLFTLLCVLISSASVRAEEPVFSFSLASTFDPRKHRVNDYLLSEKLDGVRAFWNGKQLVSRGGHVFAAPQWFLDAMPARPADGELYGGRKTFEKISGIVRQKKPHEGWREVQFMVFELPYAAGDFSQRYQQMRQLYESSGSPYWFVVKQQLPPTDPEHLNRMLLALEAQGGEGYMLKSKYAAYRSGRSEDLLKLKLSNDAEAVVLAHHKGKGRLSEVMGSMTVQAICATCKQALRFKIGSGFSDFERANPPPLGAIVTYKYNGLTNKGKPRFPVFWRIRSVPN